jgi:hypothetical protein
VKSYIRGAYSKIEVSSRSQAVLWAIQHGLLLSSEPEPARPPMTRQPVRHPVRQQVRQPVRQAAVPPVRPGMPAAR